MSIAVSVIVPAYNRGFLITETLDSILAQSRPPAELIVLDDGSTDNTGEVCRAYGDRIRYHRTENGGVCRARNIAASLATSPFLAFCDSDDFWRSDKLEKQLALHEKDERLQYSFTNFALVTDGVWSQKTEFDHAPDRSFLPYSQAGDDSLILETPFYDQILAFQPVRPSTIMISAAMFREIGEFREELRANPSEDVEFTLRCVAKPPIGIVREPVVGIRVHQSNFSGDGVRNNLGQMEIFEYVLKHHVISDETRRLVERELQLRKKAAAYDAFRLGDFTKVVSLLRDVPADLQDTKDRLKFTISKLPTPAAKLARRLLMKQ